MLVAGLFAANAAEGTVTFADLGYANAEKLEGKEIKADVISIAFSKDQGSTDPAYYTSGTAARMYAGNKVEFAAPQGSTITKIDFALANQTYNFADNDNAYVASTGTFTADPKEAKTASWTGFCRDSFHLVQKRKERGRKISAIPHLFGDCHFQYGQRD